MIRRALLAIVCLSIGCRDGVVRVGAEHALVESGVIEALRIAYEGETNKRVEIVAATSSELAGLVERGEIDAAILAGAAAQPKSLSCGGSVSVPALELAKDALVFVGPSHMPIDLREVADSSPVALLDELAKVGQLYIKARPGSVERELHDRLFRQTNNREPGNFVNAAIDGVELVRRTEQKAMALVRRSSLAVASRDAPINAWVYLADKAELETIVFGYSVPARCSHKTKDPDFITVIAGERGRSIFDHYGADRFGFALYADRADRTDRTDRQR